MSDGGECGMDFWFMGRRMQGAKLMVLYVNNKGSLNKNWEITVFQLQPGYTRSFVYFKRTHVHFIWLITVYSLESPSP